MFFCVIRESGFMNVTLGKYSATGPRCMLKQMDGIRAGRCLDGGTTTLQPGGETQVYPCLREWYQFVSFGDGHFPPEGSLYSTLPFHIVKQINDLGHEHIPYMCLGVFDRGDKDEIDWQDLEYEKSISNSTPPTPKPTTSYQAETKKELEPLSSFKGAGIVTTQCNNRGAVIEWVFVPFIDEDKEEDSLNVTASKSSEGNIAAAATIIANQTSADDQEL